jgi:hypothetical protein
MLKRQPILIQYDGYPSTGKTIGSWSTVLRTGNGYQSRTAQRKASLGRHEPGPSAGRGTGASAVPVDTSGMPVGYPSRS